MRWCWCGKSKHHPRRWVNLCVDTAFYEVMNKACYTPNCVQFTSWPQERTCEIPRLVCITLYKISLYTSQLYIAQTLPVPELAMHCTNSPCTQVSYTLYKLSLYPSQLYIVQTLPVPKSAIHCTHSPCTRVSYTLYKLFLYPNQLYIVQTLPVHESASTRT